MKKLFTLIAATILCVGAQAQSVNIHLKNGTSIYYPSNNVEYVDFNDEMYLDIEAGNFVFEEVLIGSYYWSKTNLGAASPWEPGKYYRWGESKGYYLEEAEKTSFFDGNYSKPSSFKEPEEIGSKCCPNKNYHTPTVEEFNDLIQNTSQRWGSYNSISGIWFEKTEGDSLLFFPAVQCCHEEIYATQEPYDGTSGEWGHFGCYWTKTKDPLDGNRACGFFFGSEEPTFEKKINQNNYIFNRMQNSDYKWYALPIRPCRKK